MSAPTSRLSGVVRRALVRFTACAVLAVAVLAVATVLVAEHLSHERALHEAEQQAANLANRLAAPLVTAAVREGAPGATATLDTVMDNRMRDGSVQRVKIWSRDGRVLWDDRGDLTGKSFDMDPEVIALFGTQGTWAEVSDLERAENVGERAATEMLEVYAGAVDADGEPVVVETYLTTRAMHEHASELTTAFVPLVLGTLLLFLLAVLPLAWSLARRIERAQSERTVLVQHALEAADLERRRIAHDLHDGVIQDLSGVGYLIPTVRKELDSGGDLGRARAMLDRAGEVVQGDVVALRTMLTDLYPPDLDGPGLGHALRQLVTLEAAPAGIAVEVVLPPELDLPGDPARLTYRVAREGVRNVVKHAGASRLWLEVSADGGEVEVRVTDDGTGPPPQPAGRRDGHLGLRLLADAVADAGGRLDLDAPTGGGTVLTARFPVPALAR